MKYSLAKPFLLGLVGTFLVLAPAGVSAAPMSEALGKKDLGDIQSQLQGAKNVDDIIKTMLKFTQDNIAKDPEFSGKVLSLASEYAPKITPPTVPAICADLRRIVEALPKDQVGSELQMTVVNASESFAKAPVVVAAGRPNLCEQAWIETETLFGMLPGNSPRAPHKYPPIDPPKPPPVKPSAD